MNKEITKKANMFTSEFTIGDKVHVLMEECIQAMEEHPDEDHNDHGFQGEVVKVSFTENKVQYSVFVKEDADIYTVPSHLVFPIE